MELKNRQKHINNIINFYSQILIDNPDFEMDVLSDTIYKNMVRWFDTEEDLQYDNIECGNFNYWLETFKEIPNIDVQTNDQWKYFIQLKNKSNIIYKNQNSIKLYIPLNSEGIKENIVKLFTFLAESEIVHDSKVAKDIRFDNVIIRLSNEEDAKKVIEYVNNNLDNLLLANPFTYSEDKVAVTIDGKMSYTSIMADYISLYLKELKENNKLEEAEYQDFAIFVYEYYTKTFVEKIDTGRIYNDFKLDEINIDEKALNIKQISDLFIQTLNPEFNLKMLFEYYRNNNDKTKYNEERIEFFHTLIKEEINIDDIDDLLAYAINTMSQNESNDESIKRIELYLKENDPCIIPKISGLRNYLIANNFRNKLLEKLEQECKTLVEYLNGQLEIEETQEIDVVPSTAEIMLESIEEVEILDVNPKEEIFTNAIMTTYNKYETKYQNNEYSRTGREHIYLAILQLIKKQNYDGFTLENNCRQDLMNNLTPEDAETIMRDSLKLREISIEILTKDYIDILINENTKRKEL